VLKTPRSSKAIRRLHREYQFNPSTSALKLIFKVNITLAAQHEIDSHVKEGLFRSLDIEKQKRRRPRALGLAGDNDGGAILWSPARIRRAKEELEQKAATIEQSKLNKANAKAAQEARDTEEDLQKEIRKEQRAKIAATNRASKAAISAAYQARIATNNAKKAALDSQKKAPAKGKAAPKVKEVVDLVHTKDWVDEQEIVTSRGRRRRVPKKLLD
jgi:hypothetical protein